MPFDMNEFKKRFQEAREKALNKTNKELASEISSITRLTDDEIIELFPEASDLDKLAGLIEIVNSAEARNTKINRIVENSERFGSIVLTLVQKVI